MRSLAWKLMLAFLAISLTGAALASLFARWITVREFDRLVLDGNLRSNPLPDNMFLTGVRTVETVSGQVIQVPPDGHL